MSRVFPSRFQAAVRAGLLFSCAVTFGAVACKTADADSAAASTTRAAQEPPVDVQVATVAPAKVPKLLRLTGNLRGARETDLAANVAGMVTSTHVERGQAVNSGDMIARVDVRAATLALAEAKVQVENSKLQQTISSADCVRYEQLKARGVVTDLEYDQVTAKCKLAPVSIEAAEARQRMAAKNVGDGVIRSPFKGVVTERFVDVGEYVQAPTRVVSLAQVDELKLEFSLPEQNFPDVKVGADVQFRVAAYPGQVFTGKVSRISGAVRQTRDVLVEAQVNNEDRRLLPGMFADIDVVIGEEELPAVPKQAVFEKNGKLNVFVVVNNSLEQRVLQPGITQVDGYLPVRRGVNAGETVVIADVANLKNGQKVN
jgi:membrane fusion protein (multidrug efflux system)